MYVSNWKFENRHHYRYIILIYFQMVKSIIMEEKSESFKQVVTSQSSFFYINELRNEWMLE